MPPWLVLKRLGRYVLLTVLAKISTAFEKAISEYIHFQCVAGLENGEVSCPTRNAELIGVSSAATTLWGQWRADEGKMLDYWRVKLPDLFIVLPIRRVKWNLSLIF